VIFNTKPSVAYYSPIGCRAYVYCRHIKAADKTEPRAHIGYLVGYNLSNIFRIWIPSLDRVIRTRDVIFKWQFTYKDNALNDNSRGMVTEQKVETLDLGQPLFIATADDIYTTEQFNRHLKEIKNSTIHAQKPNTGPNIEKDQCPMDSIRGTISPQCSRTLELSFTRQLNDSSLETPNSISTILPLCAQDTWLSS
jgi:hypothetical protein